LANISEQERIWRSTRPRADLIQGRHDWFRFEKNQADPNIADIWIYDEIGYFGITAADFVQELQSIQQPIINLHLNTPGGDVFDGIAIFTALKNSPAQVNIYVDALAASIGSVIAMAGDRIVMAKHSRMMIHEAFGLAIGNADDMRKMSQRLDSTSDIIASIYADRAGGDQAAWRQRMKDETWFTDQQAVDAGLADEVGSPSSTASQQAARFDLSIFQHPPTKQAASLQNAGRKASQADLNNLHGVMAGLNGYHDAVCDMGDNCPMNQASSQLQMREMDVAIPYADHGKAPEDESWSAPSLSDFTDQQWSDLSDAEKRRIAAHFVWSDSGNLPDNFSDLGGPHHNPSKTSVGPANFSAVSSGRMAQASWFDKPGVKPHLADHYHDFGKTPPWEASNNATSTPLQAELKQELEALLASTKL